MYTIEHDDAISPRFLTKVKNLKMKREEITLRSRRHGSSTVLTVTQYLVMCSNYFRISDGKGCLYCTDGRSYLPNIIPSFHFRFIPPYNPHPSKTQEYMVQETCRNCPSHGNMAFCVS